MPSKGFFSELRRRNVFKVAIAYLVLSWFIIQVTDILFPALNLPDWTVTLVVALLGIGFIPALIFSWVYELTPDGLMRESDVDPARSITTETGRRLNLITIGVLIGVLGVVLIDNFLFDRQFSDVSLSQDAVSPTNGTSTPSESDNESVPFLAVLPFNSTGSDDGGFLASGLHDDLLTKLAKLGAFKVISRTSMMEYKETTKNIRQIGEELGAGYILEGSVQAIGERVHINTQLIDAKSDSHMWAESYDRELTATNLFEIQADLALAIVRELRSTLSDIATEQVEEIPTRNTDAYRAYLRGLELNELGDRSISNLSEVVEAFETAVQLDPNFALAWAELSQARTRLARPWTTDDNEVMREEALEALAAARSLDPNLLEVDLAWVTYLAVGMNDDLRALEAIESLGERVEVDADALELKSSLYFYNHQFQKGYRTLVKAQQLNPRNVSIISKLIMYAIAVNDCDAAKIHTHEATLLAPEHAHTVANLAWYEWRCNLDPERSVDIYSGFNFTNDFSLHQARLFAIAARDYESLLEFSKIPLPEPRLMNPVFDQIDTYIALHRLGRTDAAADLLTSIGESFEDIDKTNDPEDAFWYARARAWYHAFRGEPDITKRWLEEEKTNWEAILKGHPDSDMYFWHARILAIIGLEEEAIENLNLLLSNSPEWSFPAIDVMPEFDVLKDNQAYFELQKK